MNTVSSSRQNSRKFVAFLALCFVVFLPALQEQVHAQQLYIHSTPDSASIFKDDSATFQIVVAFGKMDSVFHPDQSSHHLSVLQPGDSNFRVLTALASNFVGFDTISVRYKPLLLGHATGSVAVSIDGASWRAVFLYGIAYDYWEPRFYPLYTIPSLQEGTRSCFDAVLLINENLKSITVSQVDLVTQDQITIENPPHFPLTLGAQDTLLIRLCVHATDTIDTLKAVLTAHIVTGNIIRTPLPIQDPVKIVITLPYLGDCLETSWANFPWFYPWKLTSDTTYYFSNKQHTPITVTGARITGGDSQYFSFAQKTFPVVLAPGQMDSIHVFVVLPHDSTKSSYYSEVWFDVTGKDSNGISCPGNYVHLNARVVNSIDEDFSLFPPATNEIYFRSWDGRHVEKLVSIRNNSTKDVRIIGVVITGRDTDQYSILHWDFTADSVLHPGDSLLAYVQANLKHYWPDSALATINVLFSDTTLHASIHLIGQMYHLGVKLAQTPTVLLQLTPNPARERCTLRVRGAEELSVNVLDILGRVVYKHEHIRGNDWTESLNASNYKQGSYFVRVAGYDLNHQSFIVTRKLAIVR
jgi:Secretion system C-terminal sorting domain